MLCIIHLIPFIDTYVPDNQIYYIFFTQNFFMVLILNISVRQFYIKEGSGELYIEK